MHHPPDGSARWGSGLLTLALLGLVMLLTIALMRGRTCGTQYPYEDRSYPRRRWWQYPERRRWN